MRIFALQYAGWKLRMLRNLVQERWEYLVLAAAGGVLGLLGTLGLWKWGSRALGDLLVKGEPQVVGNFLDLFAFSMYVTYLFMALANVISRFFGPQRMDERCLLYTSPSPRD